MLEKIAKWLTRKPKLVAMMAVLMLIPAAIGYISTRINYDILSYLPEDLESSHGEKLLEEPFKMAATSMLVVESMPAGYTNSLLNDIKAIDGVSNAIWISNLMGIQIPTDMIPANFRDMFFAGDATMMIIQYSHPGASDETMEAIEQVRRACNEKCFLAVFSVVIKDTRDLMDSERARLLEGVNRILEDMIGRGSGFLRRVGSGGRYIAVVEERQLEQFANRGYDVLDKIRALDPGVSLSMSIGIGRGARTLREAQDMAEHALDMAQGRGGDQAAEMTLDGFTFYGGVSHGVEKRSKVRSRLVADQLVKLIKEADHVVIMGHRMSDLDAIGAAEGVLRICKICDVPAVIAVRRDATLAASLIDALCKAGQKDDFIDPKDALPIISKRTLCIVVDTYQVGLVESKDILEKCGKIAVIDHHRKGVGYIENPALVCHEPYSSSASELVTELLQYVGERDDKPNRIEAEGLLAGILLDTQDFTLHTGVRTFEAAAALRRYGAETERVRRLFDVTMVEYNAKADLVEKAQMYKNCAISIGGEVAPEARVAIAQAANDLLRIQGVDASFVAVQVGNGVNISARSMGAVNVQVIMESLGGGGHQTMAAAQLKHITPQAARSRIQDAIDQYYLSQKKTTPEARPAKGE